MNKKTKSSNIIALTPVLIIIGQILNVITPSIAGIIRPDFSLAFLFLCVMIKPTVKQTFLASGLVIITSMVLGSNPIFQIPSAFDRTLSALLCLLIYKLIIKSSPKLFLMKVGVTYFISTLVSGSVYVLSVYFFGKLLHISELMIVFKMGLPVLFITVVSTAFVNYFLGILLYKIVSMISKDKYLISYSSLKY
ncbi:tryptophan transporter [Lactococcus garvieae]|uniref:Putative tryptophan transport protein n=1 Tax=Lactococcus garvieae DCC43 TaxID=1231377 RepID=K2PLQ0_9LACT|nr:tryptophan transporter [Lactococcus garvieae]EKF51154.1 putative tryptophan transport protein [Lactococcus garvieae DCC43]